MRAAGEVLIEPFFPYSGWSGDLYFVSSMTQFRAMVAEDRPATLPVPPGPQVVFTIYRPPRFPLRGTVHDDFIHRALAEVQDGTWYLIVETGVYYPERFSFGEGNSREELEQEFEEFRGCRVGFGELPLSPAYWVENDDDSLIVATKP